MAPDIYQEVTDRIIGLIESGAVTGDWIKPWAAAAGEGAPLNAVTHKHYRGINVLLLWSSAAEHDFATNEWASYRQWSSRDAQVRKGEHGEQIVFFKVLEKEDENAEDGKRRIPLMRWSRVFNADQVDGYEPEKLDLEGLSEPERIGLCDAHLEGSGADIMHRGARAYYDVTRDRIVLPDLERFRGDDWALYATAFHELTHWSGAKARLDRQLSQERSKYAFEELIAELGSAYQAARLGIEPRAREDHAEYVAHWLDGLRADNRAIVSAASKASDAADYLFERSGVLDDEKEEAVA